MKLGLAMHPEKWSDSHLAMARQLGCETVIAKGSSPSGSVRASRTFGRVYTGFADQSMEQMDRFADYYDKTFRKAGTTFY